MTQTALEQPVRTVLLVDDYSFQLNGWARELQADGRTVLQALNTAEAIAHARAHRPDVAIVDLILGAEDGLDCVRELKTLLPELVVVVVSGDMSVAHAMAAVRAGAADVLVKPLSVADLVRRLECGDSLAPTTPPPPLTLDQVEWEHISRALIESNKNITQAAERLGIYRQTLQRKLRKRNRDRAES